MKAFFKQPPPSSIRDVYRDAFSIEAWSGLFGMWTLLGISFCVITSVHRIHCSLYRRLSEVFIWIAASISMQGNLRIKSLLEVLLFFNAYNQKVKLAIIRKHKGIIVGINQIRGLCWLNAGLILLQHVFLYSCSFVLYRSHSSEIS